MRLSVAWKLGLGFALVLLIMGINVFVSIRGFDAVATTYDGELMRFGRTTELVEVLGKSLEKASGAVDSYLRFGDAAVRDEFVSAHEAWNDALTELAGLDDSDEGRTLLDGAADRLETFASIGLSILDFFDINAMGRIDEAEEEAGTEIQALRDFHGQRMNVVREEAAQSAAAARSLTVAITAIAMVVGVVSAFGITRGLSRPIRAAAIAARQLGDGNLSIDELQVASGDEVGEMASSFNSMVRNFRQVIEEIRSACSSLMDSSRQLLAVADESVTATEQIAVAMQEAADGTNNQVSHVQETRDAMTQLRHAIEQIAHGARNQEQLTEQMAGALAQMVRRIEHVSTSSGQVAEASGRGLERARAGGEAVGAVVDAVGEMRTAFTVVDQRIGELGSLSQQVGQIVGMIADIAEQTNLLALNAAIEAARAGEHGRGFGVVAEEVRHLAERSAQSTNEIEQLIANIQRAVEEAVQAVEAGSSHVDSATQLTSHSREALEAIIEAIGETDGLAHGISEATRQLALESEAVERSVGEVAGLAAENSAATEQMLASNEQVMRAMAEVAAISEATAAGTEEVSAAAEEVNSSSADMKNSVQALADIAGGLESLVQKFQV